MEPADCQATTNCNDSLRELYTFLDGELTDDKRATISHHIDECSPCLEAFDFEAELRSVVAKQCHEEVPESLRRRIAASLDLIPDA